MYPKISIVTPCFNSDKFLEATIKSVLDQNYPNLEYIIIDGGSTDKTLSIIKKYENQLAYWISEKDKGMYDAIQKGFNRCSGDIMAWIGSDDMYHQKSFFTVSEIFTKFNSVKWLVGAITHLDEKGRTISIDRSRKFTRYDLLIGDFKWIQQESCFWHKSLWEKADSTLNTSLRLAGDLDLWVRFSRYEELHVTHALIGAFRIRSSNQLSLEGIDEYLKEAKIILKSEKIEGEEKRLLRNYKFIKKIRRIRILKKSWFLKKMFDKYYNNTEIHFNRTSQEFEYN